MRASRDTTRGSRTCARSGGERVDHGPIEVLDGELVPPGALAHAVPDGARLYEATGNEGASIELQFRHAVLVVWRRNSETLRMLARCGGRLALARELAQRAAVSRYRPDMEAREVMDLWERALETDAGGPEPRAHRLLLHVVEERNDKRLREHYVERVARVDLDEGAVPMLTGWIRHRLSTGEPLASWVRALGPACTKARFDEAMSGAPALLRALLEHEETESVAISLLADAHDPPTTPEAVLRHAGHIKETLAEAAWRRRRIAKMTMDDTRAGGQKHIHGDEE